MCRTLQTSSPRCCQALSRARARGEARGEAQRVEEQEEQEVNKDEECMLHWMNARARWAACERHSTVSKLGLSCLR